MSGWRKMLSGEQTWPSSPQTSSAGTTGWVEVDPASTTACRCCLPRGGRKHSPQLYWQLPGPRTLQPPACPHPRITNLGIKPWTSAALICRAVHVVWAGSPPICSTSSQYFLPVLPLSCSLARATAHWKESVSLPHVFPITTAEQPPSLSQSKRSFPLPSSYGCILT